MKLAEDDPGCVFRWGRVIYGDGTFHIGWLKRDFAFGYGIGNKWTNGEGIKIGYYDDDEFKADGKVHYDKNGPLGRKFTLQDIGLDLNKLAPVTCMEQACVHECQSESSQLQ